MTTAALSLFATMQMGSSVPQGIQCFLAQDHAVSVMSVYDHVRTDLWIRVVVICVTSSVLSLSSILFLNKTEYFKQREHF